MSKPEERLDKVAMAPTKVNVYTALKEFEELRYSKLQITRRRIFGRCFYFEGLLLLYNVMILIYGSTSMTSYEKNRERNSNKKHKDKQKERKEHSMNPADVFAYIVFLENRNNTLTFCLCFCLTLAATALIKNPQIPVTKHDK